MLLVTGFSSEANLVFLAVQIAHDGPHKVVQLLFWRHLVFSTLQRMTVQASFRVFTWDKR